MLSRVAENLYWLGRYTERAENTARIVTVNANMLMDLPRGIAPGWAPLIAITGSQEVYDEAYGEITERNVARFLLTDRNYPGSLISNLGAARENARTIRDIMPRETWEILNELFHYAADNANAGLAKRSRHNYLQDVIRGIQTFAGAMLGTANHDLGYTFLTTGRILERADMTTRIIDVRSNSLLPEQDSASNTFESVQWMSVLKSLSGYQTYRQSMRERIGRRDVLKFLLHDTEFPRAVQRCTDLIEANLKNLPEHENPLRSLSVLKRALARADLGVLVNDQAALHDFLDDIQLRLGNLHTEVANAWFLPVNPGD